MKKFLISAVIFLSAISGGMSEGRGSITVLGDSIASGYGLSEYVSGNDYSAPESFGNLLGAESTHYENYAVDGRRSEELLAAVSDETDPIVRSVAEADNVIISIGGNDFLKPLLDGIKTAALTDTDFFISLLEGEVSSGSISEYTNNILQSALTAAKAVDVNGSVSNIRKIVEKISELNPGARIILLTVYDPFAGNVLLTAASEAAEEKLSELNEGIKSLAGSNVYVADIYRAFKGHEAEYTNIGRLDIHPNSAGHNRIYEVLSEITR